MACREFDRQLRPRSCKCLRRPAALSGMAAIGGLWPLPLAWRGSPLRTMSPVYLIISVYAVMHKARVRLEADKSSIDIDID